MFTDGKRTFTDAKHTFNNGKHTFTIAEHRLQGDKTIVITPPGRSVLPDIEKHEESAES